MGVSKQLEQLYKDFCAELEKKGPRCDALCSELKVALSKAAGNQLLLSANAEQKEHLRFAREVYEKAAFWSIQKEDSAGFARNVKQLKSFYRDFGQAIGVPSSNEYKILGLHLLSLLAEDRIGEFHTELELVGNHDSPFIQRPVLLERYLMEGNYAKINESIAELKTQEHYPIFLELLLGTMRRRIVESLSTNSISVAQLQKMLYMSSPAQVAEFLAKVQEDDSMDVDGAASGASKQKWVLTGDTYHIPADGNAAKFSAYESIGNVIDYATEIERIV